MNISAAVPCGHQYCQLCPARRDLSGFTYPDEHILDAVLLEYPHILRLYVDGDYVQEVPLRARRPRRARREAEEYLTDLRLRTGRDAVRWSLDQEARDRAEVGRMVIDDLNDI